MLVILFGFFVLFCLFYYYCKIQLRPLGKNSLKWSSLKYLISQFEGAFDFPFTDKLTQILSTFSSSLFFSKRPSQSVNPNKPIYDDYFYDTRPRGARKVLNPNWATENGTPPVRLEIIDEKDIELIGKFYNCHFVNHNNVWKFLSKFFASKHFFSDFQAVF